jgi:CsoR family transcriptional regulator, copper-sensing transcriptional repressor
MVGEMTGNGTEERDKIIKRLNKIEGQIKGIRKMIEGNICCNDVLIQISAAKAAINKVGMKLLEVYSEKCINELDDSADKEKVLKELLDTLEAYMKFSG